MAKYTTNYNLTKPDENENYDIEVFNDNADTVDTELKKVNDALANKADASNVVTSVAGKTGAVTLTKSDVSLNNVDNTADTAKPISTAMQTALDKKVDTSKVLTDVPANAVFTDTKYTAGNNVSISEENVISATNTTYTEISTNEIDEGISSSLRLITGRRMKHALDKKADASKVLTDVPANAEFTDTKYTAGSNVAISEANVVSATDTKYSEITTTEIDTGTASTLRTITGRRVKYILDKVQGWIGNLTKSDVGLSNVDNVKQATKVEFDDHLAEKATQNEYGHIRLQDIPNPVVATQAEAETGTNNTKMMTPLRTNQAIENKFRWVDGLIEVNINGVWKRFEEKAPDDSTGSPGSKYLISGTMEEGFFGEVPASELITGDALASECGISQGTSQHSTEGWLKFAYKGGILFVAKKPIRHSISWDAINAAKCVYGDSGDKTVVIGGKTYKVTLMRGLEPSINPKSVTSEASGAVNHHSEWNRLMCQIHEEAINGNWSEPANIESDIGILEHSLGSGSQGMYSDADLVVGGGDGRRSWCQEMSASTSHRLHRGDYGVSYSTYGTSSGAFSSTGWRPVLKLVP